MTDAGEGDGTRLTRTGPVDQVLAELREVVPSAFQEGEFDVDRLAALLGDRALEGTGYELTWDGKGRALDAVRGAPEGTLVPDLEGSRDYESTRNLLVEGENLEVLRTLQRAYHGRVDLVCIDPPYNTGSDFLFRDDFSRDRAEYERATGQRDERGNRLVENPDASGRYHSDWLTMMYPRLHLARTLLREDGAIFVHIDDHEVHNLRCLMDEVFGAENYVTTVCWRRKKEVSNDQTGFAVRAEFLLVYGGPEFSPNRLPLDEAYVADSYRHEDEDGRRWRPVPITLDGGHQGGGYQYAVETPSGRTIDRMWRMPRETFEELREADRLYFGTDGSAIPQRKHYLEDSRGVPPDNLWLDAGTNKQGSNTVEDLLGTKVAGHTPKPVEVVRRILDVAVDEGDTVLDFFAGTGTTAQAAMEHSLEAGYDDPLSFVLVQLGAELDGDETPFDSLFDLCEARVRAAAERVEERAAGSEGTADTGFKRLSLGASNFPQWQSPTTAEGAERAVRRTLDAVRTGVADTEAALLELLLLEGFTPNADRTEVVDGEWTRVAADGRVMYVSLADEVDTESVAALDVDGETPLVCLDAALSDTAKEHLARQYALRTV
jgi:adenine-specific DNA-methyltransferase